MLTKIVLPLAHRLHIADRVIESLKAQTVETEVILLAQTVAAGEFAAASGLDWEMGETGGPGDRWSYAAVSASQPAYWAFADDDAVWEPTFLERALESLTGPVGGWWAFNFKRQNGFPKGYHSRVRVKKAGKPADYVGGLGTVVRSDVAQACGKCPPCCTWVDDLWFSGRAQSLGYRLESLGESGIEFLPEVNDEHALSLSPFLQNKDVMADYWLFPFVANPTNLDWRRKS